MPQRALQSEEFTTPSTLRPSVWTKKEEIHCASYSLTPPLTASRSCSLLSPELILVVLGNMYINCWMLF